MEFRLLGPIEVVGDAGPVPLGGERARAVLASLMLRRGHTVSTESLVHAVWSRPPATAPHAVAVYVSRLRAAIGAANGGQPIVTRGAGYALEIEAHKLDLERFRLLFSQGRGAAAADALIAWRTLGDALAVWRHPTPLSCLTTSPVADARVELEDERLSAVEERVGAGLDIGLHADLIGELRELTREHPERERLWGSLMLALYRSGRQCEALDVFVEAHRRLDDSFGIAPGPAVRDLQRRILEQDPTLDLVQPRAAPVVLPAPPSSFVGRAEDVADALELLAEPDMRLLTIIGPGGIGKTRFSIELARRTADRFVDGVWWIPLDPLDAPSQVLDEIATSVVGTSTNDPLNVLTNQLRGKRVLLVLDCFEHLLDAATDVHRLLERLPTLRVIATSRERLGLSGEHLFWLPPLAPADAATLFLARRRAVDRSSAAPSDGIVNEVCERLDRMPLAIELVASQVDARTHTQLLATLERTLDVDGRRDPPTRHRTLRATLDWSYGLLDERERGVLRRLSVFAGGFAEEAAEAVTGATQAEIDDLVGKSLVTREADEARFSLLDTVRAYATERLEQNEESEQTLARHAEWFLELARELEPETWMAASAADHATFARELPNFRLVLRRAVQMGDGAAAAAILRCLGPYMYSAVSRAEGRSLARSTLELEGADPIDRGHVLYYDAAVSMDMGLADETRVALREAESLFGAAGALDGLSMVENLRCFHEASIGNYVEACEAGERACAHARAAGSEGLGAIAEDHLAFGLLGLGADGDVRDESSLHRSLELCEASVSRAEGIGGPYALITAHGNVVSPLLELGELDLAAVHLARALELQHENAFPLPYAVISAAEMAGRLERHEIAMRLLIPCLEMLARDSVALQAYSQRRADALLAAARAALGADAFAAAESAARAMTVDDALELALSSIGAPAVRS